MSGRSLNRPEPGSAHDGVDFDGADFSRADLSDCVFTQCTFAGTQFRAAKLARAAFSNCQFNDQASETPADFSQAELREATFERCNLTVVAFTRCRGYGLSFVDCQMQGVDLSRSDFRLPIGDSDLTDLRMQRCNFSFGNLADPDSPIKDDICPAYQASKIALNAMTALFAKEFAESNARSQ